MITLSIGYCVKLNNWVYQTQKTRQQEVFNKQANEQTNKHTHAHTSIEKNWPTNYKNVSDYQAKQIMFHGL